MAQAQGVMVPDDFEGAFARLAELSAETENDSPTIPPVQVEEPQAAQPEEQPEDEDVEDGVEEDAEDDAEDEAEESAEASPDVKMTDEDLLARFAALVKKTEPQKVEPAAPQQPQKTDEPPLFSAEEEAFLKSYEEEWPDVAKAESLRRRAEYRQLLSYVFQEVAKEFRPIMDTVSVLSERTHLNDLQTAVSDYGDVRDRVIEWVGTQPAYLQAAYNHVIKNGTVEEVADLIDRYKREAGVTQQAAPVSKPKTELPPATKQAAAELAPVSSKRSAVVQAADPNDFESAFAAFADKL